MTIPLVLLSPPPLSQHFQCPKFKADRLTLKGGITLKLSQVFSPSVLLIFVDSLRSKEVVIIPTNNLGQHRTCQYGHSKGITASVTALGQHFPCIQSLQRKKTTCWSTAGK